MNINLSKGKSWIKKNWIRNNVEYFRALRFFMKKYEEKDICVVFVKDICAIKSPGTLNCRAWRLSWQYVEKWETSKFTANICLLEYNIYGEPRVRKIWNLFSEIFLPGTFMLWQMILLRPLSSLVISRWQFDSTLLLLIRLIIGGGQL